MAWSQSESRLEPEYAEAYGAWSKDRSPATTSALLRQIEPALRQSAKQHVGADDPPSLSRARQLAVQVMPQYDPTVASLRTYLSRQLIGLKRSSRKATSVLAVPERVALGRSRLDNLARELENELGRPASRAELSDRAGLPLKTVRRYLSYSPPTAEGTLDAASPGGGIDLSPVAIQSRAWRDLVYSELDPVKQAIMDLLEDPKGYSNEQIASRLRMTPSNVSQHKKKIQQLLDRERELSPF